MVVKELLNFGANPNILDKDRFSALGLAVRENNDEIAMLLLNSGKVELNIGAGNLGTPLHIAVVNHKINPVSLTPNSPPENTSIVLKMIELDADLNKADSR